MKETNKVIISLITSLSLVILMVALWPRSVTNVFGSIDQTVGLMAYMDMDLRRRAFTGVGKLRRLYRRDEGHSGFIGIASISSLIARLHFSATAMSERS